MKLSGRLMVASRRATVAGFFIVVTLLGLPLVTPLLRWTGGPCTHDGHLHFHRITAIGYAWQSGLPFSRWLPDLAFGYGYPFFIYREAPPLYLSLFPHLLGVPLPAAINLFYVLGVLAAGWFMYLWVRDVFGPLAGIIASVAYMAAPYQLVDALVRGNQPESLALALFPFLCWAGRRFMVSGRAGPFLAATLGLAFLALSHNISLLLFVPFLAAYLLAVGWMLRERGKQIMVRMAIIMVLGLGLSSFYVGTALLELDQISIDQSVNNRNNDFSFNFASVSEILDPVSAKDPLLLNPPLPIRLGWMPAGLAVLGLVSLAWTKSRERRGHIIFMGLAAAVFLFMSLAISSPLWERLPLIRFVQFPWRLVGRAALPVAFLAGVPFAGLNHLLSQGSDGLDVHRFAERRANFAPLIGIAILAVAALLLLLEALPSLYPPFCQQKAFPTINDVHAYERRTGRVGVDPTGSYFPKTVLARPEGSALEADYQSNRPPRRFDRTTLPAGARVERESYDRNSAEIQLESPAAFQARYLTFAFPGWEVLVDGRRVPIIPSVPEGLITFEVPTGQHTVTVRWRQTAQRMVLTALSVISFLGVVVFAVVLVRRGPGVENETESADLNRESPRANLEEGWGQDRFLRLTLAALIILALAFLVFKLLIVDDVETPFRREAPAPVRFPSGLSAAEMSLEGHNLSQESVAAGNSFDIDLAWRVSQTPGADYQSNVWLEGPGGQIWSDKETERPRIYEDVSPTSTWLPGRWAWDSREVMVLPGTPPGPYDIVLTLFDRADLAPLTLKGPDGQVIGPTAVIGQIEVTVPREPADIRPQYALSEEIGGLTLLGYSQDRKEVIPGEQLLLTLFWEKPVGSIRPMTAANLVLVNQVGQISQSWALAPVRKDYPPLWWREGERLRGQHSLRLDASLDSGEYQLELEGQPLGQLQVNAPERLLEKPDFTRPVDLIFSGQVALVGYTVDWPPLDSQSPMTVTMVWQGLSAMPVSYRVFVHLIDAEGEILAQSDGEPADWLRPTTSWAPGEYIVDQRRLATPAGIDRDGLSLRVGLYDFDSGERLSVDGSEFVVVPLGEIDQ